MTQSYRPKYDEPIMSDALLLLTVEDLINISMGHPEKNVVNFKLLQAVLHILARQLRILEQRVEIKVPQTDFPRASMESTASKEAMDQRGGKEKASKEKEKPDKSTTKEKEKPDKSTTKEKEKPDKSTTKEKEKPDKGTTKEKEKPDKSTIKEKEKPDKSTTKEKEDKKPKEQAIKEPEKKLRSEKERSRPEKELQSELEEKEKTDRKTLKVKEVQRDKEKVLIVEKGPTTRVDSRTNIDVVTQSQFELLKMAVKELQDKAKPLPPLALPDNQKLREDLAKGSASLTDTMQAMQVNARVQAAELAVNRMAELLTHLASSGALPKDVAGKISLVTSDILTSTSSMPQGGKGETAMAQGGKAETSMAQGGKAETDGHLAGLVGIGTAGTKEDKLKTARKSVAILDIPADAIESAEKTVPYDTASLSSKASQMKAMSPIMSKGSSVGLTNKQMDAALQALKDELLKNMNSLTNRATTVAENALATARGVEEKLKIALELNMRISNLHSTVTDYAEQLSGFDIGITTQIQSFKEQMLQMQADLKSGLTLLENVNNNAETAAVKELTERYGDLVTELDNTLHTHQALTKFQSQLGDELRRLAESIEVLQEQKADTDEVMDGLRDKADNSRLAGLMTEEEFSLVREQLATRLALCNNKFSKQEKVWLRALKELSSIVDAKAELMQLMGTRDDAQAQLQDLHRNLHKLADILGEPKAAMLTRKLSEGGVCGACAAPALMSPHERRVNEPPALPALRPRPAPCGAEEPCLVRIKEPEDGGHICARWVGGSHTLLKPGVVTREVAVSLPTGTPTTKFTGQGRDGRLYRMEVEMEPCKECNMLATDLDDALVVEPAPMDGGGDQGECRCTD